MCFYPSDRQQEKEAGRGKKKGWSAGEFACFCAAGAATYGILWLTVKKDAFLAFSAAAVWVISGLVLLRLLSGAEKK